MSHELVYKCHPGPQSMVHLTAFCGKDTRIHNGSCTLVELKPFQGPDVHRPLSGDNEVGPLLNHCQ